MSSSVNVTIKGDTASATSEFHRPVSVFAARSSLSVSLCFHVVLNVTSEFHLLPSCNGCIVFSINSTASNISKLLQAMGVGTAEEEIRTRAVYLLGRKFLV